MFLRERVLLDTAVITFVTRMQKINIEYKCKLFNLFQVLIE